MAKGATAKAEAPRRIRLHFRDQGQAFLWWDLAGNGGAYLVVDADPRAAANWKGTLVKREPLAAGECPVFKAPRMKAWATLNYPIARVELDAPMPPRQLSGVPS